MEAAPQANRLDTQRQIDPISDFLFEVIHDQIRLAFDPDFVQVERFHSMAHSATGEKSP
jgi:hypothetical protein